MIIFLVTRLWREGLVKNILVVCPKSAIGVWKRQLRQHLAVAYRVGERSRRHDTLTFSLINFERAWRISEDLKGYDCVVVDECHPSGTMIETPSGSKPIEVLKVGDKAYGIDHATGELTSTVINHIFVRETNESLWCVGKTRMTPEHPVWTLENGYIPAHLVLDSHIVCRIVLNHETEKESNRKAARKQTSSDLRMVRKAVFGRQASSSVLRKVVLFDKSSSYTRMESQSSSLDVKSYCAAFSTEKIENSSTLRLQPVSRSNRQRKSTGNFETHGISDAQWRQREITAETARVARSEIGVDNRVCSTDGTKNGRWLSDLLQGRYCRAEVKDRNRSRWEIPRQQNGQKSRHQEGRVFGLSRLENSAIQEQRNFNQFGLNRKKNQEAHTVYNIETETGNYFAEGLLVHNSHRIKAHNSRQSIACWKIGEGVRYKFALTGTPTDENEIDLWAQFRFLRSELLGDNWHWFRKKWMRKTGFHNFKRKLKKHLVKSYLVLLAPYTFQITRKEVLDLPPEEDYVIPFELTGNAKRVYHELETKLTTKIAGQEINAPLAVTNLSKLMQITGGFLKTEDALLHLEQDKLATLVDWLEDYPIKTKIVIFCKFTAEIDAIKKVLSRKRTVGVLDGRTKDETVWERFQDKADPALIVCQIDKASVAIELSVADIGVFYSKGFSYIAYDQARARLLGQNKRVMFVHLIAEKTTDEDQMAVLQKKHWTALSILHQLQRRRKRDQL
jgi:hypothetical protein